MRVLFVDDEPMILKSLSICMRRDRPDWECAYASDGLGALRLLDDRAFDAIVADVRMPGMDGAELLARVRATHPGATRVVLTGHAERSIMTRALGVAHGFLSKPCEIDDIIACLERLLPGGTSA